MTDNEYSKENMRIRRGYYQRERRAKKVLNTVTNEIYPSISEASRASGINKNTLRENLIGSTKENKTIYVLVDY